MTVQDIIDRCCRFSGYQLAGEVEVGKYDTPLLNIGDPDKIKSLLCIEMARTVIPTNRPVLYEVYGRMRHWAITLEEEAVIWRFLRKVEQRTKPGGDLVGYRGTLTLESCESASAEDAKAALSAVVSITMDTLEGNSPFPDPEEELDQIEL